MTGFHPRQEKVVAAMARERADKQLVTRGFFESRSAARAAIEAGKVTADGVPVTKANQLLDLEANILAEAAHPYVSRGGLKLAYALDLWPDIRVEGRYCLDIGASTGGFTDVLLQRGAAHVLAVDVGTGQLHPKIANDPRVTSLEQTDARDLTAKQVDGVGLIVCDASFIALEKLLGPVLQHVGEIVPCDLVLLFKPQFQVGRKNIGKNGIVSSAEAAIEAEIQFKAWLASQGAIVIKTADSPIPGGDGNRERLIWAFSGL